MDEKEIRECVDKIIGILDSCNDDERTEVLDRAGLCVDAVPIYAATILSDPCMLAGTAGPDIPAPIDVNSDMEYLDMLKEKKEYGSIKSMIYRLKYELKKINETFTLVDALMVSKLSFKDKKVPKLYDHFLTELFDFRYTINGLDIDY